MPETKKKLHPEDINSDVKIINNIKLNNGNLQYRSDGYWYRNNKRIDNKDLYKYKYYNTKTNSYMRLHHNGNVSAIAKGKNYMGYSDYDANIKHITRKYENIRKNRAASFSDRVLRLFPGTNKISDNVYKFINDSENAERNKIEEQYRNEKNRAIRRASDRLNRIIHLQEVRPNIGKLARWDFDKTVDSFLSDSEINPEDEYTYKTKDARVIPKTSKLLAGESVNIEDLIAIREAAKRNNMDYYTLLSIAAGETGIGNVQGWSQGDKRNNERVRIAGRRNYDTGTYSSLVHDHIYQKRADIPANSELLYYSKANPSDNEPFDVYNLNFDKLPSDITSARANKLITDSENYIKTRGTSLDHIARMWQANPNSLNPRNDLVDKGRSYYDKVKYNEALLRQIKELNPTTFKVGGKIFLR